MNSLKDQTEEPDYSYTNKPPSVAAATSRLDETTKSIATIGADLDSKRETDFATPELYADWRVRASRALAHRNRESLFLIGWLTAERQRSEREQQMALNRERADELHALVAAFLRTAPPYKVCFSKANPPKSLPEAEARRQNLAELKLEYGGFLTRLKERSLAIGCPTAQFMAARGRVARVVEKAEKELLVIKNYSRALERPRPGLDPMPSGNPDLQGINMEIRQLKERIGADSAGMTVWLFNLVDAVKETVSLTPEQVEKLELIRQYVELTLRRRAIEFPA